MARPRKPCADCGARPWAASIQTSEGQRKLCEPCAQRVWQSKPGDPTPAKEPDPPKPDLASDEAYFAYNAVSASLLKRMVLSPRHAWWYMTHPSEPTPAMRFGTLIHRAVLEPATLARDVAVWGGYRKGKDWTSFVEANPGKTILNATEYAKLEQIVEAVQAHQDACSVLYGPGEREKPVPWVHPRTGLQCKSRIDLVRSDPRLMVEVKTTGKLGADRRRFQNDCAALGYDIQLAFYADALATLGLMVSVVAVVVETVEPYSVAVFDATEENMLCFGRERYENCIDQYIDCVEKYGLTGRPWPGPFEQDRQELILPTWARPESDEGNQAMAALAEMAEKGDVIQ